MIVNNLNIFRTFIAPAKANSPLLIDPNAEPPQTIAL
jgi:hypothetical protein